MMKAKKQLKQTGRPAVKPVRPAAQRSPFFTGWVSNFLSNVSGVVVGIALTLGVNYLVQQHSADRQTRTMMALVKREIAGNKEALERMSDDFIRTKDACGTLLSARRKEISPDSLEQILFYARKVTSYPVQYTAWEVFCNSDIIKSFDDRELIVVFSEFYSTLKEMLRWWDVYSDEKKGAMIFHTQAPSQAGFVEELLKNEQARRFMTGLTEGSYTFEEPLATLTDFAAYVLHLIGQSGKPLADIRGLDEEIREFRENTGRTP
jgi:hypothetical protein